MTLRARIIREKRPKGLSAVEYAAVAIAARRGEIRFVTLWQQTDANVRAPLAAPSAGDRQ